MESRVRQNFASNSEALINKQINLELYASYVYMAMHAFFDRDDQALHGLAKKFLADSTEEREHALKLMHYQNMRGGRVCFQKVDAPNKNEWKSALEAVEDALELEKTVNESLLDLHKRAEESRDPQMCDFIESNYLEEQVEAIKELGDLCAKLKRAGDGIGIHIIDKELQ